MYNNPVAAISTNRFSIFSHSLGDHSVHDLPNKLTSAACGGFLAVEISLIDLEDYATSKRYTLIEAAEEIGELCKLLRLNVSCLQPLRDVIESTSSQDVIIQKATQLFPIMDALNTELLVCCSSFLTNDSIDGSVSTAINNLRAIGIAAANWSPNPKKIAFEALSWGTFINLWSQAWGVVRSVNLDNVGICLDSFNTLAREWADPTHETGIQADAEEKLKKSMSDLSKIPGSKIFLLQIGDGARLNKPIEKGTIEKPALMSWSRSSRLFPMEYELGGYLPIMEFIQAVIKTGYVGYWSLEVFNDSLKSKKISTPILHSIRGFNSLSKLSRLLFSNSVLHDNLVLQNSNIKIIPNYHSISIASESSSESSSNLSPTHSNLSDSNNQIVTYF